MSIAKKIIVFAACVTVAFAKTHLTPKTCSAVKECQTIGSANGFSRAITDGEKGACMRTCIASITDEVVESSEKNCRKEWAMCCIETCF